MFLKRSDPHSLAVSMTGVKMGDRLVHVGCVNSGRLGAVAAKVGLSGRAAAAVPDEASAARARKGGEQAGVLVDVEVAPPSRLPFEDAAFDVAVVDDTNGLFGSMAGDERASAVRELVRVLRPGGRIVLIGATPRSGLGAMLSRPPSAPPFVLSPDALRALDANGFKAARMIGDREGLAFVEAVKPRAASSQPGEAGRAG